MRMHERVLAEGTFRLALTKQHRLVAALDAHTALGPVHVVVHVDHGFTFAPRREALERSILGHEMGFTGHEMGFSFPKIKLPGVLKDVAHVAEKAFTTAAKVAPYIAMPALSIVHAAAQNGAHLIAQHASFIPRDVRNKLEAASRVLSRAKLGDIDARKFIGKVLVAARDNVPGARAIADKLLDANRFIDRAVETVQTLQRPGDKLMDPNKRAERLLSAIGKGDWNAVRSMAHSELGAVQGAASMIPGVGTAASAAIGAGLSALEGGSPLDIGLRTAYAAIPIPPALREVTDAALEAVLSLSHGASLTDTAIAAARHGVPEGMARDVFDTLMNIVVKRMPIQNAGAEMLERYVQHYGGEALRAIPLPASLNGTTPALLLPPAEDAARMMRPLHLSSGLA